LAAVARAHPRATILYWHTLSSARPPAASGPEALPPGFPPAFAGAVAV